MSVSNYIQSLLFNISNLMNTKTRSFLYYIHSFHFEICHQRGQYKCYFQNVHCKLGTEEILRFKTSVLFEIFNI